MAEDANRKLIAMYDKVTYEGETWTVTGISGDGLLTIEDKDDVWIEVQSFEVTVLD